MHNFLFYFLFYFFYFLLIYIGAKVKKKFFLRKTSIFFSIKKLKFVIFIFRRYRKINEDSHFSGEDKGQYSVCHYSVPKDSYSGIRLNFFNFLTSSNFFKLLQTSSNNTQNTPASRRGISHLNVSAVLSYVVINSLKIGIVILLWCKGRP